MQTATTYEHIVLDAAGVPVIDGANTKVIEIVADMKAYGWSAEEIHFQHPHLSLGQIHSALAFYFDNAEELDRDLKNRKAKVGDIRSRVGTTYIKDKLEGEGLI